MLAPSVRGGIGVDLRLVALWEAVYGYFAVRPEFGVFDELDGLLR